MGLVIDGHEVKGLALGGNVFVKKSSTGILYKARLNGNVGMFKVSDYHFTNSYDISTYYLTDADLNVYGEFAFTDIAFVIAKLISPSSDDERNSYFLVSKDKITVIGGGN